MIKKKIKYSFFALIGLDALRMRNHYGDEQLSMFINCTRFSVSTLFKWLRGRGTFVVEFVMV